MKKMKRKKSTPNGKQPATQADLAVWGGELTRRMDGLEGQMGGLTGQMGTLENRMDGLETTMQEVKNISKHTLEIVQVMDADRREEKAIHIPERVTQLEKDNSYLHKEVLKLKQRAA